MGPCDIFFFVVANNPVGGDGGVTYRATPLFPRSPSHCLGSRSLRGDSARSVSTVGAVRVLPLIGAPYRPVVKRQSIGPRRTIPDRTISYQRFSSSYVLRSPFSFSDLVVYFYLVPQLCGAQP